MTSCVYLIQGKETKRCKIGMTRDLEKRMRKLQTGSAEVFEVLAQANPPDAARCERRLHDRYAAYRLHLEWFEFPPDVLVEVISTLNAEPTSAPEVQQQMCMAFTEAQRTSDNPLRNEATAALEALDALKTDPGMVCLRAHGGCISRAHEEFARVGDGYADDELLVIIPLNRMGMFLEAIVEVARVNE